MGRLLNEATRHGNDAELFAGPVHACADQMAQFDLIRNDPAFVAPLAAAEAGRQRARESFRAAGGEQILAQ